MNDGSLNFDTKVNTKGFDGGMNKIGNIAKHTFGTLGNVAKNSLSIIGNIAKGTSLAISGAIASVGTLGTKYNMEMETYITNFGTMLGSMERGAELMKEMEKLASSTPLQMRGLAQASQTLLSFEAVSEDELIPTLRMLGDVALGDENKLASLSLAFGQMSSTGKLMGQDLLQFINAGFNPLNEISKRTGESISELKERMGTTGISVEEVTQAFKDATKEGGKFYKAMENASKTSKGQLSTLKDNTSALFGEITKHFNVELADKILPNVNEVIDDALTQTRERGIPGLISVLSEIKQTAFDNIKQQLPQWIAQGHAIILNVIQGIKDKKDEILKVSKEVFGGIKTALETIIPEALQLSKDALDGIIKYFKSDEAKEDLKKGIKGLIDGAIELLKELPDFIEKIGDLATTFVEKLSDALTDEETYTKFSDGMKSFFNLVFTEILPDLEAFGGRILKAILKGAFKNWTNFSKDVHETVSGILGGIGVTTKPSQMNHGGGGVSYPGLNPNTNSGGSYDSLKDVLNKGEGSSSYLDYLNKGGFGNLQWGNNGGGLVGPPRPTTIVNNFNQPVQTPDEFAKAIDRMNTSRMVG